MVRALVSIRVNTKLADEAKRELGAKSRAEAVRLAVRMVIGKTPIPGAHEEAAQQTAIRRPPRTK